MARDEYDSQILDLLNSDYASVDDEGVILNRTISQSKARDILRPGSGLAYNLKKSIFETAKRPFIQYKPVFVMSDKSTSQENVSVSVSALEDVLEHIGMRGMIPIHKFHDWKQGEGPHESLDWYIQRAYDNQRNQCDLMKFWRDLGQDPIQEVRPHFEVVLLSDKDLYSSRYPQYGFLIGEGPRMGTVISLMRYPQDKDAVRTAALHEFGHTFGDFSHCGGVGDSVPGECTMKFPNVIPYHLQEQADYRKRSGKIFCDKHKKPDWALNPLYCVDTRIFPELKQVSDALKSNSMKMKQIVDSGRLALFRTKVKVESDGN